MAVAAPRCLVFAAAGGLSGLLLLCAGASLAQQWEPAPITADRVLERYENRVELAIFAGAEPSWCTAVFEHTEICTWTLSDRETGWRPLAITVPTEYQIHLVCELPTDGKGREPGSCSVHPRRTNRSQWKPPFSNDRMERTRRKRLENKEAAAERRRQAAHFVDAARTLMDLSRLVGKGPESCVLPESSLRWRCVWRADPETEGHGTLVTAAGAEYDQKVTLDCFLPADRSLRSLESCTISVGG